jgi:hypothetical protein
VSGSITLTVDPTARSRAPLPVSVGGAIVAAAAAVILVWLLWPTPPGPVVLHAGTSHYVVTATVDSARMGGTAVEVDLATRAGAPLDRAMVQIQAVMPLMGHATPPVTADSAGGGRYRAAQVPLMMTGAWELQLSIAAPDGVDTLMLPLSVTG